MGISNIDQIILSTNEDPVYMNFWKPVAWAYKKIFPDVQIHLAFLTNRSEEDELVKEFRQYGKVTLFKPLEDVPEFGQAKMIRFILASQQGDSVCYIDDIDIYPLSRSFITDKTSKRQKGKLLCVGGEVYNNDGRYPVSQMTAEGYIWKELINPRGLSYIDLINTFKGNTLFDAREDIMIELDFSKDSYFSDERLIRRLLAETLIPIQEMRRGYDNFLESTLDRFRWEVNLEKLNNHVYFNAHGIRPYKEKEYEPLRQYIINNYGN